MLPESKRYPTADLNPLGSRLLGLASWQDPVEDTAPASQGTGVAGATAPAAQSGELSCAASA